MIRLVAPFRPFPPESDIHRHLPDFDWIGAIEMLRASAARIGVWPFHVITDHDTGLPLPCLKFDTIHRRLMLWYLEVGLRYLESEHFDRDTIALDSDQLIYGDLEALASVNADLVICVRTHKKYSRNLPILNGVQVWRHRGKARLIAFYRRALEIAEALPDDRIVWGADTDALKILLDPLDLGLHQRAGLTVHLRDADTVIEPFTSDFRDRMAAGRPVTPTRPIVDFRNTRKLDMRPMFEYTIGAEARCAS